MIKKSVITADDKNVPHPLEDIHIFCSVSLNVSKRMVVDASNSLLTVMFKALHASWVISVDFFFKKFTQKKKNQVA